MPFVPDKNKHKDFSLSLDLARQLHAAVSTVKKIQYLAKTWAGDFVQLLKSKEAEEVKATLAWYCEHIKDDYVPSAHSGRMFRLKYVRIREAMVRSDTGIVISTRAAALADDLLRFHTWPPEIRTKLPILVQKSLDALQDFSKRVDFYLDKHQPKTAEAASPEQRFLLRAVGPRLWMLPHDWFVAASNRIGFMAHYVSDPTKLALDFKSERFLNSFWHDWAHMWCGRSEAFDDLLKELTEDIHVRK